MTKNANRRWFLRFMSALGGSALIGGSSAQTRTAAACRATRRDAKGPYYISGTPTVANLNRWGQSGEPVRIIGRVVDAREPDRPIVNVRVELWHADGEGRYHPQSDGPAWRYEDRELDLRGTLLTDESGTYSVASVVPGEYEPRPRHIHYRLSAPGYKTLITQIYVSDGEKVPGGPCRSARIDRTGGGAKISVPDILLVRA